MRHEACNGLYKLSLSGLEGGESINRSFLLLAASTLLKFLPDAQALKPLRVGRFVSLSLSLCLALPCPYLCPSSVSLPLKLYACLYFILCLYPSPILSVSHCVSYSLIRLFRYLPCLFFLFSFSLFIMLPLFRLSPSLSPNDPWSLSCP